MIITSLLDQDWYKFLMFYASLTPIKQLNNESLSDQPVTYSFTCRTGENVAEIIPQLKNELAAWDRLRLHPDEVDYVVEQLNESSDSIYNEIANIRLNPNRDIRLNSNGKDLQLTISGPWKRAIFYEIPLLATINQLYYENLARKTQRSLCKAEADALIRFSKKNLSGLNVSEFGTRRRFSKPMQEHILRCSPLATSNVMFAMQYKRSVIGTMAHEWIMAGQGIFHPLDSQKEMLAIWKERHQEKFLIALSDTLGSKKFCYDFPNNQLIDSFIGVRHDSGDPYEWTDRVLEMYKFHGVPATSKLLVYSDSLTPEVAHRIDEYVGGRARTSFGIGTNLTNDVPGFKPMNIVIKMTSFRGRPVAKISDAPGKAMCPDKNYLEWLKSEVQ